MNMKNIFAALMVMGFVATTAQADDHTAKHEEAVAAEHAEINAKADAKKAEVNAEAAKEHKKAKKKAAAH